MKDKEPVKLSQAFELGNQEFRIDQIMETLEFSEALLADGFEGALVGHTQGPNIVAVYDYDLCIHILMDRDDMSCTEAIEFMEFNFVGAYVGEKTPVFISVA
ncbi:MAG: hypothetical protein P8J32_05815 [bacterium]|nr:hypothetical protein [bacterium]